MRCTLLLSLACAAVAGCGDHHGLPGEDMAVSNDMSVSTDMGIGDMAMYPDDIRKYVSFTMFAKDFANALCAHYMACGQLDAAQMAACVERNLRHTGWDQDIEITKGRMEVNEAQCIDAVNHARCDFSDDGAWTARCSQFLYTPHQANGATCLSEVECMSGFCKHSGSDAGMATQPDGCPGVCADPLPIGATCRLSSDCGANGVCDSTAHTCDQRSALNQSCTNPFGVGSGRPCQFGLLCPTFPSGTPTCVLPSMQTTLHGACDPFQGATTPVPPCGPGMYCRVTYSDGAACSTAGPCGTVIGGYCDTAAGVCKVPNGGSCENKQMNMGDSCDPHYESLLSVVVNQCADGLHCTQLPGQTTTTCQPYVADTGACAADGQCKQGLSCVGGHCTPWLSDGQTCTSNPQCSANACIVDNPDAGAIKSCQVRKSFGATCIPGFEDGICELSDLPGSTSCAPTTGGSGTCAPRCF